MPIIDNRNQQKLVKQVRALAIKYCPEWKDIASIESDKQADALIQIFSRMMEIIIQRLNKAPDKNFLAFLDMVGVQLSPPHVAKAPLTFTMAVGAAQYGFIPKGAQVATDEDVVFETEKDITVILPKVVKAVSINPKDDRWIDHSPLFFEKRGDGAEAIFKGKDLIPHRLYLGHSRLFGFEEPATITLNVQLKNEIALKDSTNWEVRWYYYTDDSPEPKPITASGENSVINLLKGGEITFNDISGISEKTLTGFEKDTGLQKSWKNNWIFAELKTPILKDKVLLPEIDTIKAGVQIQSASATLLPELAFFNNISIDLTKDFYPFGEKPKFNDTFYIGSEEVFSKQNAQITIDVTLSEGIDVPNTTNIRLIWEFWDGKSWMKIWETTNKGVDSPKGDYSFSDTTNAFMKDGNVIFKCPIVEAKEENGKENYWIRVRIIGGNYGEEAKYEATPMGSVTGTGTISSSGINITGSGTGFTKEIRIGESITAAGQTRIVTAIASDTALTIDSAFG